MNSSPRVSVCRSGRQHSGQESRQHLARKDLRSQVGSRAGKVLSPAGQSPRWPMPRKMSVVWSSTLGCGARGSQQWSGACLSYTLRVFWVFSISILAPLMVSVEFSHHRAYLWVVPLCRHGYSDMCADILGVSPCQMCLL